MAIFNIPQFIETEDKIAGPLTAKQLGLLIAAAVTVFVIYIFMGKTAAFVLAIPVLLVFGSFAFYKPNGQPLAFIAGSLVQFIFHPKLYVWRRLPEERAPKKEGRRKETSKAADKKVLTEEKISEISSLLDSPQKQPAKRARGEIIFSDSSLKKKAEPKVELISSSRIIKSDGNKAANQYKKNDKNQFTLKAAKPELSNEPKKESVGKPKTKIRILTSPEEEFERKKYGNITFK